MNHAYTKDAGICATIVMIEVAMLKEICGCVIVATRSVMYNDYFLLCCGGKRIMGRYTNKCEICDKFKSHKQTCRNCESTEATWEISLDCQCPHCKKYIDIFDQWHTHEMYNDLNVGESKELLYWVVDCPICNDQFYIEEVRY